MKEKLGKKNDQYNKPIKTINVLNLFLALHELGKHFIMSHSYLHATSTTKRTQRHDSQSHNIVTLLSVLKYCTTFDSCSSLHSNSRNWFSNICFLCSSCITLSCATCIK